MASLLFDESTYKNFCDAISAPNAKEKLSNGERFSPKGVATTDSCLEDAISLLAAISADNNPAISAYAQVDMGDLGGVAYGGLIDYLKGVDMFGNSGPHVNMPTSMAVVYAIDVERHLFEHFKTMFDDAEMPKNYRKYAGEIAIDLSLKIGSDYRNLCAMMNRAGKTPILPEKIEKVKVLKDAPTNKNLYTIFKYVNENYDDLARAVLSEAMLADSDISSKKIKKGSRKNVGVKIANVGQKIAPNKNLGKDYADLFGDKRIIRGAAVAAGLIGAAVVTAVIAKSCTNENIGPIEDTTEAETIVSGDVEHDTIVNNPADDFEVPETEPETNENGEYETEVDTNDYEKPVDPSGRQEEGGSSNDYQYPWETGFADEDKNPETEADTLTETNPTETEAVTEAETEEIITDIGNPAEDVEDYEGTVPNRGGSSSSREEETEEWDDGPVAGRF